eukprot:m.621116 g.621116  ORF g.621116 m.621116 type:complete len:317 (+) comp58211_c0_seq2:140-1090(+)
MGSALSKLRHVKGGDARLEWSMQGELGAGSYGKVHCVRHRQTGALAAAKIALITDDRHLLQFAEEVHILGAARHANMTNFISGFYFESALWIIIELASAGALADIMRRQGAVLTEPQIRAVAHQLTNGLVFLHANAIMHRDLNASNVLLADSCLVKIADFGVSAKMRSPRDRRSSFIGTPNWMAPEVIVCEKDRSRSYDNRCDIWSLGVTLIELAELRAPHHDLHPMKVLFKISSALPPTLAQAGRWTEDFHSLLRFMMVKPAVKRPWAHELPEHPFLRSGALSDPLRALYETKSRTEKAGAALQPSRSKAALVRP